MINVMTYTVMVHVSGSGEGTTGVDLYGDSYNQTQAGTSSDFSLRFTSVPDGDYTVRATYGSSEVRGYVTVSGSDNSVNIAMPFR
jgi:hypothetical protein